MRSNDSKYLNNMLLNTYIIFSYCLIILSYQININLISEGFLEIIQEIILFLTVIVSFIKLKITNKNLFYKFLLVISIFLLLEETSYLQKYIGYKSPDFFIKYNRQQEFNLHNTSFPIESLLGILFVIYLIKFRKLKTDYLPKIKFLIFFFVFSYFLIKSYKFEGMSKDKLYDTDEHLEICCYVFILFLSIVENKLYLFPSKLGIKK